MAQHLHCKAKKISDVTFCNKTIDFSLQVAIYYLKKKANYKNIKLNKIFIKIDDIKVNSFHTWVIHSVLISSICLQNQHNQTSFRRCY